IIPSTKEPGAPWGPSPAANAWTRATSDPPGRHTYDIRGGRRTEPQREGRGEPLSLADQEGTFLPDPANRVADRAPGGYSVRLSFAADVCEEPFTAMPTPHVTRRAEVWV